VEGTRRRLGDIALAAAQSSLIGCVAIRGCGVTASVRGLIVTVIIPGEPVECTIDGCSCLCPSRD
jgi:hypothetical protein